MATKIQDILVTVGTYEKDGQQKFRSRNIGSIWKNDDGHCYAQFDVLALDSKLVALNSRATKKVEDKIFASLFDVKPADPGSKSAAAPAHADDEEDIPY
jgi:hypothetical protein